MLRHFEIPSRRSQSIADAQSICNATKMFVIDQAIERIRDGTITGYLL
jgi:hypothetical protein